MIPATVRRLESPGELGAAAALAAEAHAGLRSVRPFLPPRDEGHLLPRLEWIREHGELEGLMDGERLVAFLGGFIIEDFRNAGPGALCPDWCHGAAAGTDIQRAYRRLYAESAEAWIEKSARIHCACLYASETEALDAFGLTGFGRIVMDAAAPTARVIELTARAAGLPTRAAGRLPAGGLAVERAGPRDAAVLAALDARLAEHIGAPPVLMPNTSGDDEEEWRAWFDREDAVSFIATDDSGKAIGFIKAEAPQFDVSYAVHDPSDLAIDGMFVLPEVRGSGAGRRLLAELARHAAETGKTTMSVDCETLNPEAYGFWTSWFEPVSWSLERRV